MAANVTKAIAHDGAMRQHPTVAAEIVPEMASAPKTIAAICIIDFKEVRNEERLPRVPIKRGKERPIVTPPMTTPLIGFETAIHPMMKRARENIPSFASQIKATLLKAFFKVAVYVVWIVWMFGIALLVVLDQRHYIIFKSHMLLKKYF